MYAEMKSNNQLLVNRLDDNERLLLKDFCERANADNTEIEITALNDESAEFGGILLEIVESTEDDIEA